MINLNCYNKCMVIKIYEIKSFKNQSFIFFYSIKGLIITKNEKK